MCLRRHFAVTRHHDKCGLLLVDDALVFAMAHLRLDFDRIGQPWPSRCLACGSNTLACRSRDLTLQLAPSLRLCIDALCEFCADVHSLPRRADSASMWCAMHMRTCVYVCEPVCRAVVGTSFTSMRRMCRTSHHSPSGRAEPSHCTRHVARNWR